MSFKACVSLLIFCLDDLSIGVSEVLEERVHAKEYDLYWRVICDVAKQIEEERA